MRSIGRPSRILVIEQHATLLDGLVSLLTSQQDLQSVETATTMEEARTKFAETSPDVTIIDVGMPDQAGMEVLRAVRRSRPDAVIIALVSYEWEDLALEAVKAGASAFLPKDRIRSELVDLIRASTRA